jgi:hypothetical protein
MYEIKAIVKKGEHASILNRRQNWKTFGNFNFIDLNFMARLFRFSNLEASSVAYLEYIADEASEDSYPIPATKDTLSL